MFEQVEKLPDWQKMLILVGIPIIIPALLYFLLINPKISEIEQLENQITEISNKVYKLKNINQRLKHLENEINTLNTEYRKLCKKLTESKDVYTLLNKVYQLAVDNHIDILEFRRGSATKNQQNYLYYTIPIKMTVNGGYHSIAKFFEQVGNLDRIVNVGKLTMNAISPPKGGTSINAKFTLLTYTLSGIKEQPKKRKGRKTRGKKKR